MMPEHTSGVTGLRGALARLLSSHVARFALVGLTTNAVDFSLFALGVYVAGLAVVWANIISYSAGATFSFCANRAWTFGHSAANGRLKHQLAKFIAMNAVGIILSTALVAFLSGLTFPWLAKVVTTLVLVLWFYIVSRFFVYR